VNIKERLDFSCALFNAQGHLIANAPHMPVHLGSMGESIQTVIRDNAGAMKPGDVFALNDPYHGGTHLPDVTVITPVFDGDRPLFWLGSRGHHADIGQRLLEWIGRGSRQESPILEPLRGETSVTPSQTPRGRVVWAGCSSTPWPEASEGRCSCHKLDLRLRAKNVQQRAGDGLHPWTLDAAREPVTSAGR
jgi:hypothetical protein